MKTLLSNTKKDVRKSVELKQKNIKIIIIIMGIKIESSNDGKWKRKS